MPSTRSATDRLILALDVPDAAAALQWAHRVRGRAGTVKVGLELFVAAGPQVVRALRDSGTEVFLDLKLHDIPNTVAHAVRSAASLDIRFLTLHAGGGERMLSAAVQAARESGSSMKLLGVTVLTSLDDFELHSLGWQGTAADLAISWTSISQRAGLSGVVASAQEAVALRRIAGGMLLVTPGIRSAGDAHADQTRVSTAGAAIRNGADYLVVGRSVTAAARPEAALDDLLEEIEAAATASA